MILLLVPCHASAVSRLLLCLLMPEAGSIGHANASMPAASGRRVMPRSRIAGW